MCFFFPHLADGVPHNVSVVNPNYICDIMESAVGLICSVFLAGQGGVGTRYVAGVVLFE